MSDTIPIVRSAATSNTSLIWSFTVGMMDKHIIFAGERVYIKRWRRGLHKCESLNHVLNIWQVTNGAFHWFVNPKKINGAIFESDLNRIIHWLIRVRIRRKFRTSYGSDVDLMSIQCIYSVRPFLGGREINTSDTGTDVPHCRTPLRVLYTRKSTTYL